MSLHRSSETPDWEKVAPEDRNIWQKIAAETNGALTPGNVLTIGSLALTAWGVVDIYRGKKGRGVTKIVLSRSLDLVDGLVAEHTGTKSQLGKYLDAGNDMINKAAAVAVASDQFNMPPAVCATMYGINLIESGAILSHKSKWGALQPPRTGKYATFGEFTSVGAYVLSDILKDKNHAKEARTLRKLAHVAFGASIALRTIAASKLITEVNHSEPKN